MSDGENHGHAGLLGGIISALPLGVALGLLVFHSLALGLATMLVVGTLAGLFADWLRGRR